MKIICTGVSTQIHVSKRYYFLFDQLHNTHTIQIAAATEHNYMKRNNEYINSMFWFFFIFCHSMQKITTTYFNQMKFFSTYLNANHQVQINCCKKIHCTIAYANYFHSHDVHEIAGKWMIPLMGKWICGIQFNYNVL